MTNQWCWLIVALVLAAPSLAEAGMSLGTNLGVVRLSSDGSSSLSLSAPSDLYFGIQPGLRLGFTGEKGMDQTYFDAGLVMVEDASLWAVTANYQRNFLRSPTSPYVTLGGGFHAYSFGGTLEANPLFGGGLGVTHRLANGHGELRAEFRVDALRAPQSGNTLTSVGLKTGFDLWLQ